MVIFLDSWVKLLDKHPLDIKVKQYSILVQYTSIDKLELQNNITLIIDQNTTINMILNAPYIIFWNLGFKLFDMHQCIYWIKKNRIAFLFNILYLID